MNQTILDERTERMRHQLLTKRQEIQRQIDEALAQHRANQIQLREEAVADPEDMSLRDSTDHQQLSIVEARNQTRNLLDIALRRLDEGTYGLCEDCQATISEQRLKALPFARRCIDCQRHAELLEQIARKEDREDI
ncbi:MAG TPA: TraR/DksA C4-type zinc finger protein [Nitrospiraceae bacterium]|jgi:DnaK suppressor protein|nr:TraR/DksA C4-type zinc finger protein [Nitrospiraceae bacterium]